MSLLRAILGKDREEFRSVTRNIHAAVKANIIAADKLIEAIELRSALTEREEEHRKQVHNALAHKQRRFRGGFP